jgi:peroxiredoxin
MIYAFKRLIKPFICIVPVFFSVHADAQVALLQNAIIKINSYKSLSYRSVNKKKELFSSDTITEHQHAILIKEPEDKNFGYLIKIETVNAHDKAIYIDLYNGQNIIHISPQDSTYSMQNIHAFGFQSTLLGCLQWIQSRLQKRSSTIVGAKDTTVNAVDSYHLIANVYDTVINKERNYTIVDLFIDKLSGRPNYIIIRSRNSTFGDGISTYHSESSYSDYKFNEDNIDLSSMTIPNGYHTPKEQSVLPKEQTRLLALADVAPDWTLYDANGNKTSLSQMKGKVLMIDFFFIGCEGCMKSLKSLNKIDEKYKDQNVAIVSLTERDNKKSILEFEKNYHIKYPAYLNAANEVRSYHVISFPTFYFVNKEGKIANVINGYSDDFEEKSVSIIDGLLKKQ